MKIADILEKAADLIEPEGAWTQGHYALNAKGQSTGLTGFRGAAVCWCVAGATAQIAGADGSDCEADAFLHDFLGQDVEEWNDADERTQPEVVAKLREAAAKAREQGL